MAGNAAKIYNRDVNLAGGSRLIKGETVIVDASGNIVAPIAETLAEGSMYIGNASNVTSELSIKDNGKILVGNGTTATSVAVSGDITLSNAGVVAIATGAIVNADVNGSAAIDFSKLAALPSAQLLVGSAGNVATAVAMSGDATLSNAGALTIANSAVTNAKVSASAAIDFSKLAVLTSGNILVGSAGNVATSVAMSGDATISNAGALTIANSAVTLAKLAAGITPSHIVKYGGKENNGGGSATIVITVAGALATDLAFAQLEASSNAVNVQKVTPAADSVTVLLSGDPGAATVLTYQVLRAAA